MSNWKVQSVPDAHDSGTSKVFQNPRHFGMVPKTLTLDKSVSHAAFRVFALLALQNYQKGRKTNIAQISTRELADKIGSSHTAVRRWLKQLQTTGHIEILGKARGKATYRLSSPVFDYRVHVETAPGSVAEVSSAVLPAIRDKKRRCPRCKKTVRTGTSGVCDECLREWAARIA